MICITYYAHSTENPDKSDWQSLKDHLINVAEISSGFADDFSAGELAYAGGLLHDLGKYSDEFQRRLEGSSIRVDHSTAGAREAGTYFNPFQSRIFQYIIAGHHGGLMNYGSAESGLEERLNKAFLSDYSAYRDEIQMPDLDSVRPGLKPLKNRAGFTISFYIRMLYSCLVDADSLDTEEFMNPEKSSVRGHYDSSDTLFRRFDSHMNAMLSGAEDNQINRYRREIYEQCRKKSDLPTQIFSLTVPTGGGKTLSSMAFALAHLKKNGLERIFYVIPYTSIIEQNAGVFRGIFGSQNVLEHHSNFDPKSVKWEDSDSQRMIELSSENWDIPIVVTTNVQFFESLFSGRRSRCRKLHNLAKSVIILDEAQMLPTGYLKPCLSALSELVQNYGSSVVICTATQPKIGELLDESLRPLEIMDSPEELYEAFRRVHVSDLGEMNDDELSARLNEHDQVLCIVNTRNHAKKLYDQLSGAGNCFHLSARMCPAHRRKQLAEIKRLLKEGSECQVISTQLIEAGVDIDFPVVYRAMTGIDSVAQAAGRCNREGRSDSGEVCVFKSTEIYGRATSWQRRVAEIGEMVMADSDDPISLLAVAEYFRKLYFYEGDDALDKKKILLSLEERAKELAFSFEDIDDEFNLIEGGTKDIVIPYDDSVRSIIKQIRETGFAKNYGRGLQGYSVSVYPNEFRELENAGVLDVVGERYNVLNTESLYSEETGLLKSSDDEDLSELLIG